MRLLFGDSLHYEELSGLLTLNGLLLDQIESIVGPSLGHENLQLVRVASVN